MADSRATLTAAVEELAARARQIMGYLTTSPPNSTSASAELHQQPPVDVAAARPQAESLREAADELTRRAV